jgi:hypothetical protein
MMQAMRSWVRWCLLVALACASLPAGAQLTQVQKTAIKQAIESDPVLNLHAANSAFQEIATALNADATPDFIVWKRTLSRHDILTGTSSEATTFSWAAGAYITRSQGERDAFREMFNSTGNVNPALPTIQAAFNDIFSGAGGAGNRAHILAMSKRKASRVEKLFTTGTGSGASPGALVYEGPITPDDVGNALVGG